MSHRMDAIERSEGARLPRVLPPGKFFCGAGWLGLQPCMHATGAVVWQRLELPRVTAGSSQGLAGQHVSSIDAEISHAVVAPCCRPGRLPH